MQPSLERHERAAEPVVRPQQPIFDPEALTERERPGLLREERVGPALDEESVAMLRPNRPAHAVGRLEERELDGAASLLGPLDDAVGGGQARDARPDDGDLHRGADPTRTRSASISTKRG